MFSKTLASLFALFFIAMLVLVSASTCSGNRKLRWVGYPWPRAAALVRG